MLVLRARRSARRLRLVAVGALVLGLVVPAVPAQAAICLSLSLTCPSQPAAEPTSTTTAQPTAPAQLYGFNDGGLYNSQVPRGAFLDRLQGSGAKLLRYSVSWQYYEPSFGNYQQGSLAGADQNYRDLLSRGIREVIVLLGTPNWAVSPLGQGAQSPDGEIRCDGSSAPCVAPPDLSRPDVLSEWQSFVRMIANRYPQAAAIEVWNEPNLQYFWLQPQNPALYAHLLATTTQAVHQVNPAMTVLSGSVADYFGPNTSDETSADSFVQSVYATVGGSAFDAIGYHAYICNFPDKASTFSVDVTTQKIRAVRDSFGDSAKPLWLTETGATTSGGNQANCAGGQFTEAQQAQVLSDVLAWTASENRAHHDLPVTLVNTLFDVEGRPWLSMPNHDADGEYGLVAWSYNGLTRVTSIKDKPAYASVTCSFSGGC